MATSDWVLSRWGSSQQGLLQRIRERAAEVTLALLQQGVTETMNQFNGHEPIEQ